MEKFNLYLDGKVEVWNRVHFIIEAESEQEAAQKLRNHVSEQGGFLSAANPAPGIDIVSDEFLYETMDLTEPLENDNQVTLEIVTADKEEKYLWRNIE